MRTLPPCLGHLGVQDFLGPILIPLFLTGMQLKLSSPHYPRYAPARFPLRRLAVLACALSMAAWWGQRQFKLWFCPAEAIVVLGGEVERETFAAQLAQKYQNLPVWVSSGTNPEYAEWLFFEEAGLARDRVHLDYEAIDTVTNFTTLVSRLKAAGIQKLYLVTSDNHMRRASLIGEIVLGSQGIVFEAVQVPSSLEQEPLNKTLRDGVRALVWTVTGYTGAELGAKLKAQL